MENEEISRAESFRRQQKAIKDECDNRIRRGQCKRVIERCETCPLGIRLRRLENIYSDVSGWSHDYWKESAATKMTDNKGDRE